MIVIRCRGDEVVLRLEPGERLPEAGECVKLAPKMTWHVRAVYDCVPLGAVVNGSDIATKLRKSRANVGNALTRLVDLGLIERVAMGEYRRVVAR